jgi:hypothetical protein
MVSLALAILHPKRRARKMWLHQSDDLQIVGGSPKFRRKFVDRTGFTGHQIFYLADLSGKLDRFCFGLFLATGMTAVL